VVAGTVLSIHHLAAYFNNVAGGNEAAFTQEMGGAKPAAAQFEALREQALRYMPEFNTVYPPSVSGDSCAALFWLQAKLLEEQRLYIAAHANCAEDDHDDDLLTDAEEAVQAAEEAEAAAVCQGLREKFNEAMNANKHADSNQQAGGNHGYISRMLEQICGQDGDVFEDHKGELFNTRRQLNKAARRLSNSTCGADYKVTSEEQSLLDRIQDGNGWSPNEIPNLKDAALCVGWVAVRARNNSAEILDLVTRLMR